MTHRCDDCRRPCEDLLVPPDGCSGGLCPDCHARTMSGRTGPRPGLRPTLVIAAAVILAVVVATLI